MHKILILLLFVAIVFAADSDQASKSGTPADHREDLDPYHNEALIPRSFSLALTNLFVLIVGVFCANSSWWMQGNSFSMFGFALIAFTGLAGFIRFAMAPELIRFNHVISRFTANVGVPMIELALFYQRAGKRVANPNAHFIAWLIGLLIGSSIFTFTRFYHIYGAFIVVVSTIAGSAICLINKPVTLWPGVTGNALFIASSLVGSRGTVFYSLFWSADLLHLLIGFACLFLLDALKDVVPLTK